MGLYKWTWDDWWREAAYTVLIRIADLLEDWFFPLKERRDPPSSNADGWSGDETLHRLRNPILTWDIRGKFFPLDERTGAKVLYQINEDIPSVQNHEALAMQLVRQHTRIPVPRLYQTYWHPLDKDNTWLIMDHIKGEQLEHAWPKLSWLARARVAWTLRSYIRQLRKIRTKLSRVPGPLGPRPLRCEGYNWYSIRECGPFPDSAALFALFESYHGEPGSPKKSPVYDGFEEPQPLVFTHNDLCPRNVVLGDDGQVWLIDWGFSGFFPDFFEYTSMSLAAKRNPVPPSWTMYIPFISDPHHARELWVMGSGD